MARKIDLIAEATWVSCCVESPAEANGFALAANQWADLHPLQLTECPFEEHIPKTAFAVQFVAGDYEGGWACYCHCSWILQRHCRTVHEATLEARRYFDEDGVSYLSFEWMVFGDHETLPNGSPLYVFDPEIRIYEVLDCQNIDEYLLSGGYDAIVVEKVRRQTFGT